MCSLPSGWIGGHLAGSAVRLKSLCLSLFLNPRARDLAQLATSVARILDDVAILSRPSKTSQELGVAVKTLCALLRPTPHDLESMVS